MQIDLTPELAVVIVMVTSGCIGVIWRMSNLASRVASLEQDLEVLHNRIDGVKELLEELDRKLDGVVTHQARIDERLESIGDRIEMLGSQRGRDSDV